MLNREWTFRFAPHIIISLFLVTLPALVGLASVSLVTKILIFGLFAMSLDFIFGYAGLWSLCHAALFGVGAYTTGILITHYGIENFWLAAPAGILIAGFVACVFGLIAIKVSAVYFLLITFALGELVFGLAHKWTQMTGGSDGLGGVPYPNIGFSFSSTTYYYFVLVIFTVCSILLYRIINSTFGLTLQGIRESEVRMRCLGYNTWLFKFIAFIVSGLFAGLAGILYVHFNGLITPEDIGVAVSGTLMLMVIIGGSGTLWGAVIGSGVILSLQYFISAFTPERWPLIVGAIFVGVIMFLRGGIFPHLISLWMKVSKI